ncbi:pectin lyase fold/virulence factor [Vibrio phage 1.228.O._10N.261.49.C1]|nr:pectin lyase fold/virulence factor [Vibrio phage 1.157.O._10N.261.45.B7]AUR96618.1 pectin lyase fold/virulence factor [Vibrio phage 1.228.O._10N.261.49.C1]
MSCEDYPTKQTAKTFKLDAETINEVVTSSDDRTPPASDGLTKKTLAGIENDATNQLADIQQRADEQYSDINNQYVLRNKGDYSTDPLLEFYYEFTGFNGLIYFPIVAPYQVDSATYPDPSNDPNLRLGQATDDSLITATGSTTPRRLDDRFAEVANVVDFGATGDGVTDDTASFLLALGTGKAVYIPNGNYLVSHPTPIDPGDESIFKIDDTTSNTIIGEGPNAKILIDKDNTIPCSVFGLSRRFGGELDVQIGNFTIDGNGWIEQNPQSSVFTGVRGISLQSGTTISANYKVNLLDVWFNDCTEGVYIGVDYCTFGNVYCSGAVGHGFALANRTDEGVSHTYGSSVFCVTSRQNTDGGLGVDLSGGSSANQGDHYCSIGSIHIDGFYGGMKIAGLYDFKSESISIFRSSVNTAAFYTNSDFRVANIGTLKIENCAGHAFSNAHSGVMKIGLLVTEGNTQSIPQSSNGELAFGSNADCYIEEVRLVAGPNNTRIIYSTTDSIRWRIGSLRAHGFTAGTSYPIELRASESAVLRDFIFDGVWTAAYFVRVDAPYAELELKVTQANANNLIVTNGSQTKQLNLVNCDFTQVNSNPIFDTDNNPIICSNVKGYTHFVTGTELGDASSGINNNGKWKGRTIYDTTLDIYVTASGDLSTDTWSDMTGNVVYTPS